MAINTHALLPFRLSVVDWAMSRGKYHSVTPGTTSFPTIQFGTGTTSGTALTTDIEAAVTEFMVEAVRLVLTVELTVAVETGKMSTVELTLSVAAGYCTCNNTRGSWHWANS